MYVHVEVLDGKGCLAGFGSHAEDNIVVRVGEPENWDGVRGMPSITITAPIMAVPSGVAISQKLSDKIKRQITKRAVHRAMDKYQLRLYVLKHDGEKAKWLGIVAVRLLSLTAGYVVERWVPMKPATKTEPGQLRLRLVVRESQEDALAVLKMASVTPHTRVDEGCCCGQCDPHFQVGNPVIEYFDFDEKHGIPSKAGRVLANAMVCNLQ